MKKMQDLKRWNRLENGVCAPIGFTASGMHCGIRKNKTKKDLALIVSEKMCSAGAVYTQNKVQGAPILVTKTHLQNGYAKAVLVNSGNANTCNADGVEIADAMCKALAASSDIQEEDVIIASTGVIGQKLPIEPICEAMPSLVKALHKNGAGDAAEAIMTTDTFSKELAFSFVLKNDAGEDITVRIGGMAKGSGMIHPNMATMLVFVTGDVAIAPNLVGDLAKEVADVTFNMVSVDGDTSTNDMLSMMFNGMAKNAVITKKNTDYEIVKQALISLCTELSKMIAKDGEGATKLLTCEVRHAATQADAKLAAKSVICSALFKSAMFGRDANWGRVLCAIGYSGANVDVNRIDVRFVSKVGEILVCENGSSVDHPVFETGFDENLARDILSEDEIIIDIDLKQGNEFATAWGCDLTYDYVKINGDYRT